jgi:pimeloyl-ACP methyl ester carboxylesterase
MHPVCFQRALVRDPEQRAASQYFHKLRSDGAAALMAEDNFRRTMNMLAGFSQINWMTPEKQVGYLAAWSQPGALEAMLHWYSSSPLIVPKPGEIINDAPLLAIDRERVLVRMPHLVVWGEADEALRPVCLEDLHTFASDLSIHRVPGAGHWILHERPELVAGAIRSFVT